MLSISTGLIYWDVFISLVGMGFFMYGKKRPDIPAVAIGVILMVYPYFVGSVGYSIAAGAGIIGVYVILKRVVGL